MSDEYYFYLFFIFKLFKKFIEVYLIHNILFLFLKIFYIGVELTYNVVLVSGV